MINFERILCPVDFSEYSRHALQYACALTEKCGSELHLLHVMPDPAATLATYGPIAGYLPADWAESMQQRATSQLSEIPEKTWAAGRKIVRATNQGVAYVEIIQYVRDNGIQLIIIGTGTDRDHVILGSVTEKVVRKAPCPVLTIHPKDH